MSIKMQSVKGFRLLLLAAAAASVAAGCGGGGGGSDGSTSQVGIVVKSASGGATAQAMAASALTSSGRTASASITPMSVTVSAGTDSLVITKVSLTLQDIDLERTSQSVDCGDSANADDEDCSDAIAGPIRLDLDLSPGNAGSRLDVTAAAGTYDVISFDISVPDGGDPAELQYLEANPDLAGASVRVEGTFNDTLFEFTTDVRGDREVLLVPQLELPKDGVVGATVDLVFEVKEWFLRADNSVIDPSVAMSEPEGVDAETIRENIRRSIESGSASD